MLRFLGTGFVALAADESAGGDRSDSEQDEYPLGNQGAFHSFCELQISIRRYNGRMPEKCNQKKLGFSPNKLDPLAVHLFKMREKKSGQKYKGMTVTTS